MFSGASGAARHRRRNNGKGRIQSALANAHGRNAKDASRHPVPDAPDASTIGGAAPDTIIGPAAADRAGARPRPVPQRNCVGQQFRRKYQFRWPAGWQRMGYRSLQILSRCRQRAGPSDQSQDRSLSQGSRHSELGVPLAHAPAIDCSARNPFSNNRMFNGG